MKYIEGIDRNQAVLFPVCIEEMIDENAEVRIIDLFVDALPLEQLGEFNDPVEEGRPQYHPSVLFKLYIYGYLNRIRTSRLLERECKRNIELIWLLNGLHPCFRTIAGFRSQNSDLFRNTFKHFLSQINKKSLIGGKTVAIDSSKFRAVNSKKNNFNKRKIDRQVEYIDNKIEAYLEELDKEDFPESKKVEIHQKILKQRKQKRKYKQIEKQLKESGEDQISTTDPDARSMILHGQVIEVAYNVQTIADEKHKLIVDYKVTNQNDRKALLPMAILAKEACGVDVITALADKGYHNGEQIAACERENVTTFVSPQEVPRSNPVPVPEYYGDKFRYNKKKDFYTCPQEHTMKTTGHWYNKKYDRFVTRVKHYKTSACRNCPALQLCTRNPNGRLIERSEHAGSVERNNNRVRNNTATYSRRQEIIEHIFGTIKRQWGYDHILLKGLEKNDGEFGLIYLIYNFRRVLNIFGHKKLKTWLKKLCISILLTITHYKTYRLQFHF